MRKLDLGGLRIPAGEAVVRAFGILAKRGAGKSNAAVVLAEEMHAAGAQWIAVDPKGDWWGVRSSGDGKGPGLAVPIFGGDHADVPLEPGGGRALAELLVSERISAVVDVSGFTESEKLTFLAGTPRTEGFAQALYRAKRAEVGPLHLFLEEAHDYIPQQPRGEKARAVDAFGRIVTQGRTRGLGVTMISQRAARLHKDVLTQVDALVVLRIIGPQDRDAVEGWLKHHGQAREIVASLATLGDGEAWLWAPEWLGVTERFQFRRRRTFDSGATPTEESAKARRAATLAEVDLDAIRSRMAASIERAKADDPKALRKRIADLEAQLARASAPSPVTQDALDGALAEVDERARKALVVGRILQDLAGAATALEVAVAGLIGRVNEAIAENATLPLARSHARDGQSPAPLRGRRFAEQARTVRPELARDPSAGKVGGGERRMLAAIAQHPDGVTREQLTVLIGLRRSSRNTYLQRLRSAGLAVEDEQTQTWQATPAGVAELGDDFEPLPTGEALLEHWLGKLPQSEAAILGELAKARGWVDRETISSIVGLKRSSRNTYLQRLAARKLIETNGRDVRAAAMLFD